MTNVRIPSVTEYSPYVQDAQDTATNVFGLGLAGHVVIVRFSRRAAIENAPRRWSVLSKHLYHMTVS